MMTNKELDMLFQTSIPIRDTDENELRDLIQRLAKIAGSEFEIDRRLMVSTDSSFLSTLLESVADAISNGHAEQIAIKKPKAPKKQKSQKKNDGVKHEPTRGPHVRSIKVIATAEMISRHELNKRLADHAIQ